MAATLDVIRDAVISECGLYRYRLTRRWHHGPIATFIMLNPSTADAAVDDATIRKCIGFAGRWGMGGLAVGNLFAFRSTDPRALRQAADPIGPENDRYLEEMCREASTPLLMQASALMSFPKHGRVVCAWGANGSYRGRDAEFLRRAIEWGIRPLALRITSKGAPEHPLYVPYDVKPIEIETPVPAPLPVEEG